MDLADFIDWVKFHRREWTDDELERYYNTIEHIAEKLVKHRGISGPGYSKSRTIFWRSRRPESSAANSSRTISSPST